jgi:glycosyltransferase involved in cell wall biosynthesis
MTFRVLAAATNHPDPINPINGLFNKRSIESIKQRDVDVNVVSPRPFAPPIGPYSQYRQIPQTSKSTGYEVHYPRFFYGVPKKILYGLSGRSYAKRIPKYVERTFDASEIVHAFHIYLDGYGMIDYCQNHNVPLVAVAHGTILNDYESFSPGVQSKIRETLEACQTLICVSDALATRANELVPQINTELVPIGADPKRFPTNEKEQIRNEMGISQDSPVIIFCGSYTENKGVKEIMAVLPELSDCQARFIFIGHDGPLRIPLEKTIHEAGMENQIDVLYDVSDERLPKCFAIADLLLLPSHREGRPTVIYEAMASETAVLATDVGGIPEQVNDGKTGRLISPKNTSQLQDVLLSLCEDIDALQAMGQTGRQQLDDKGWTWKGHAKRVVDIYEETIVQHRNTNTNPKL